MVFHGNLAERRGNWLLVERIDELRKAFVHVNNKHPFKIDAIVVLPERLHCVLTFPEGDGDVSMRWGLNKANFSRTLEAGERIPKSRKSRGERGVWQRRFWEHLIGGADIDVSVFAARE